MNATSDSLAVVKARLPYTARGSFSQAWFSALHLASDVAAPQRALAHRPLDLAARVACDARHVEDGTPPRAGRSQTIANRDARREANLATAAAPRGTRNAAARARATLAASVRATADAAAPLRATFSIGAGGARVQLVLRRERDTLHVLAICSAGNATLVRRALALAEQAFRAGGSAMCGAVRTVEEAAP